MVSSSRGTTVSKRLNMSFNMNVNKSDQALVPNLGPAILSKVGEIACRPR
jgi:hypothetical protein